LQADTALQNSEIACFPLHEEQMQRTYGLRAGCRLEAVRLLGCVRGGYSCIGDFSAFFTADGLFHRRDAEKTQRTAEKNKSQFLKIPEAPRWGGAKRGDDSRISNKPQVNTDNLNTKEAKNIKSTCVNLCLSVVY